MPLLGLLTPVSSSGNSMTEDMMSIYVTKNLFEKGIVEVADDDLIQYTNHGQVYYTVGRQHALKLGTDCFAYHSEAVAKAEHMCTVERIRLEAELARVDELFNDLGQYESPKD